MLLSFITTLAWFGLSFGILAILLDFHTWYETEYTKIGKLRQDLLRVDGKQYVNRPPKKAALVAVISLAWLITVY